LTSFADSDSPPQFKEKSVSSGFPHVSSPYVREIAPHVFAYIQPEGGWCVSNAGIITGGAETVLVDTAATERRARLLRDSALRLSPDAPRLLINTHFHGDHTFGNFVFPEARIVAHERTREEMAAAGLHLTGLWPQVTWGSISVSLPSLTYRDRMVIHAGETRLELFHPGLAHSTGDTIIWLPQHAVLFAGDIVMSGVTPFVPMGSVSGSLAVIAELRRLGAATIVPGHGPVAGPEIFDETEGYLRWLQVLAREGLAAGLTPFDAAKQADLGTYAQWADPERVVPNLHRAYAEEQDALSRQSLDIGALFAEMINYHGGLPACHV
jgi:cyclase